MDRSLQRGPGAWAEAADGRSAEQRREQMLRAAHRGDRGARVRGHQDRGRRRARAGTSPALVIYYFKTRDQLLTEALRYSEDAWYEAGTRRMAAIPTRGRAAGGAGRHELPASSTGGASRTSSWLLWLDLWALSLRLPGWPRPAEVRRAVAGDDQLLVLAGQEAGRVRRRWTPTTSRSRCPPCSTGWPSRSRSEDPSVAAGAGVRSGHAVRVRPAGIRMGRGASPGR